MSQYRLESGERIFVEVLTKEACFKHVEKLLEIHNTIPFQNWTSAQFLSEGDEQRVYHGKWEISRCVFTAQGSLCGFCIGFERSADLPDYPINAIYMHRMAVCPNQRFRGIGVILHCDALHGSFQRGVRIIDSPSKVYIYGQTNDTEENINLIGFHADAGYKFVGKKLYADREDWIMRMSEEDFRSSKHYRYWMAARDL